MNYKCIIVIYNVLYNNSHSLISLMGNSVDIENIIICDNSTSNEIKSVNEKYFRENSFNYINMYGNLGLSKAYNLALQNIKSDWVIILDQDTKIPDSFFLSLENSINKYPNVAIHVPIIKSGGINISPSKINKYNIEKNSQIPLGVNTNITAINSGMAVKRELYDKVGYYNEDMFLDYIDHWFIREYKKHFNEIAVFDCTLIQEFSENDHSSFERDFRRYNIYRKDFFIFCSDNLMGRIFYYFKIYYRALKLSIIHKNIKFIISNFGRGK